MKESERKENLMNSDGFLKKEFAEHLRLPVSCIFRFYPAPDSATYPALNSATYSAGDSGSIRH